MNSDTIMQGHIMAMAHAALNHNALIVQLASEVIAAGPGQKTTQLKRIRREFEKIHAAYTAEMERIKSEIAKNIAEGRIHD